MSKYITLGQKEREVRGVKLVAGAASQPSLRAPTDRRWIVNERTDTPVRLQHFPARFISAQSLRHNYICHSLG